ncbi:SRPBCC family protein [Actinokineospora sp. HUAS TT18]|uniref:SRPBCC family protein n=1 Tax=Actinokineospora sp. HUAS TT18 TaxID=3447451 RepID=UPI003F520417
MTDYDLIDEAFINTSPDVVWEALIAELGGARRWWVPTNTFEAGAIPADKVGAEVHVTVHTKGVDKGGPKLKFTSRTTSVVPGRRLTFEYVDGAFLGTGDFRLDEVDGGTKLAMHFTAAPQGILKVLAKVKDLGEAHSQGTQGAFANLNALVGAR